MLHEREESTLSVPGENWSVTKAVSPSYAAAVLGAEGRSARGEVPLRTAGRRPQAAALAS